MKQLLVQITLLIPSLITLHACNTTARIQDAYPRRADSTGPGQYGLEDASYAAGRKECIPNDLMGCSCKFTDGSGIVDLSSLGTSDNTPRFRDVKGMQGDDLFSYSPCYGFSEGQGKCTDAAMCLTTRATDAIKLGDAGNAMFAYNAESGNLVVAYNTQSGILLVSEVELGCDKSACQPIFTPQGQPDVGNYKFTLTHVCACPDMCTSTGPVNDCASTGGVGLGPGSILLIIFASVVLLYVTAGSAFTRVQKNAKGTDMLPNKDMWAGLAGLIKAGVLFTFSACSKKRPYTTV